jgi:UDP-glucuronate 4-epimerase
MSSPKSVLVTGCAGFIGFHLALRLLEKGHQVCGLDNVNEYYDVRLKWDRLRLLEPHSGFRFCQIGLEGRSGVEECFRKARFDVVVNLAAQAGVRNSLRDPYTYVESNVTGFMNLLEACRHQQTGHLVFASSSSVYGANETMPFSVHHNVDHPLSIYAATKKANELMAHTYAHLYRLPCTGLRFFTVYGPWGRPDMALFLFTKAILAGEPIQVFNHGKMRRDFTYIDDIVDGIVRVMEKPPAPDPAWTGLSPDPGSSSAPYRLYNIGNNRPVELMEFIGAIEDCLGIKARKEMMPMQPGDVPETCADIEDISRDFGFRPGTPVREGIARFVEWYRSYYA